MRKIDLLLIPIVTAAVAFSVWSILEWDKENQEEYNASMAVANELRALDASMTDCDEVREKLMTITFEEFDGKELIEEAWTEKSQELGC